MEEKYELEVVEGRRGGRTVVGRGRCVGRESGRGAERKTNRNRVEEDVEEEE